MTPQMQQSIQLLQLNAIELEQLAQQELIENPFLTLDEETPTGEVEVEGERGESTPEMDFAEPVAAVLSSQKLAFLTPVPGERIT